ncbi:MAG: helix-turn-helix transcriptional regulator [Eggerthellales bacterium]|nr:helix-turn-helix transcriptional regulator [Eggerthellales bacterium]
MDDFDKPLYMISIAAELAGVHPQTLRMYEQKGLITPKRTGGNTRMYSQADIERLNMISELTSEGINLAGVIRILDLQGRLDQRDKEIDDLHKRVRRLADRVHELETRATVSDLVDSASKDTSLMDPVSTTAIRRIFIDD